MQTKDFQEFKFDSKKQALLKQKYIEDYYGYTSPLFVVSELRNIKYIVIQPNNIIKEEK
jgi:hypothetical protein